MKLEAEKPTKRVAYRGVFSDIDSAGEAAQQFIFTAVLIVARMVARILSAIVRCFYELAMLLVDYLLVSWCFLGEDTEYYLTLKINGGVKDAER